MRCFSTFASLLAVLSIGSAVQAQDELPLAIPFNVPGVTYDEAVPTPQDVLGHVIGERHTRPHEIVDYVQAVAEASDRVIMDEYARTYEHRPLVYAVITSAANQARLDEIRAANLRLSDEPESVSDEAVAEMPVVVNMHYSVHGNEASGAEAALLTLYHLAAGQGDAVESILDRAVVILDPLINPDGRDRFVDWVNGNRGGTSDPQDREHDEPWPGGRTNHYLFDLNRDWLPVQHPESIGRLELFHRWRPQVLIDAHEMGSESSFFFQPGIPSRNNPNTPPETFDLTAELATYHAAQLDRIGSFYYSENSFDDFYYGKGSTYPDVNGAVGVLFEQASSRSLQAETSDGLLSYAFTIRNHVAASMSTLEGAVAMREKLLRHQRNFYRSAPEVARANPVKGYVIGHGGDRTRAQALAQVLRRHRVRVYELAQPVTVDGTGFEPGAAYVIPLDQPQTRLITGMMERVTTFQDSLFYDVSAWTLPLAFGVPHVELSRDVGALLGDEMTDIELDGGERIGGEARYAYLMEWGRYYAPRALYRVREAGIRPRVAMEPVEVDVNGQRVRFDRGTIVIPVTQRDAGSGVTPEQVHALVQRIVEEDHVVVHALQTGLTPVGQDLGYLPVLEQPRIALVAGPGTGSYQVGETWHLLDERMEIPVSLLDASNLGSVDLSRYNTLVLPSLDGGISEEGVDALSAWIRGGGCLIAMENAVPWAIREGLVDETLKEPEPDTIRVLYGDVSPALGAQAIGGTIFEAAVDTTHPLAFGYGPRVPLFRAHESFLNPSIEPGATVARYTGSPRLSGYISEKRLDQIERTAALIGRRSGQGSVVLIADNPNFRAFWYGTNGLFLNAVFFGRIF